jgi:hypothetical protein
LRKLGRLFGICSDEIDFAPQSDLSAPATHRAGTQKTGKSVPMD